MSQVVQAYQLLQATDSGYLVDVELAAFAGVRDMEGVGTGPAADGSGRRRRRFPAGLNFLRGQLSDQKIQSCADVLPYCIPAGNKTLKANIVARAFCPESCGCVSPASGTIWV